MWGCFFLAKSFLACSNIKVVAVDSAMGSVLVRPAEKSRLILLGQDFQRALQQRQKVWRKVNWQCLAEAWASTGHSPRAWFVSSKSRSRQAGDIIFKNSFGLCVLPKLG